MTTTTTKWNHRLEGWRLYVTIYQLEQAESQWWWSWEGKVDRRKEKEREKKIGNDGIWNWAVLSAAFTYIVKMHWSFSILLFQKYIYSCYRLFFNFYPRKLSLVLKRWGRRSRLISIYIIVAVHTSESGHFKSLKQIGGDDMGMLSAGVPSSCCHLLDLPLLGDLWLSPLIVR